MLCLKVLKYFIAMKLVLPIFLYALFFLDINDINFSDCS